ncbi:cell division ATPase MinD, archaeal [Salinarchaeum sp. Harcht-Bsk1]|uniref:nucleotide-binding protein n=1 Tax=Salinarchaeum sp. Harcht-Bsk1 TaxID=1333523 RepID=UPI000342369C|nr:cell division ATPase MinD, archaeal [Salinarchaeum sp. Harcht-Bsk1]AGN02344.1 cell division ATPase MinD, archaeal [Salinarchaeum sp. Harcht-Bsk1]
MSSVVAVVGTIAGAGTTTAVTALGSALGEQRQRVALVDATEEGSRLTDAIDLDGAGDLTDALRRGTAVGDVQAAGPHDIAAFPADPDTNWGAIRPNAVATLYDQLRDRFDVVLVDCGATLSPAQSAWLGHADAVTIVTDPDVAGAVPETVALAGAFDVPVRGVLANRVPPKEVDDAVEALESTDQPVLGVLPEDPTVGAAAEAGASVLRTEPDSMIATCAWELGLRFRDGDHDEPVLPMSGGPSRTASTATDDGEADDGQASEEIGETEREEAHEREPDDSAPTSDDGNDRDGQTDRDGESDASASGPARSDTADVVAEESESEPPTSTGASGTSTQGPAKSAAPVSVEGAETVASRDADESRAGGASNDPSQPRESGTDEASTADAEETTGDAASTDDTIPTDDDPFTNPEAKPAEPPTDEAASRTPLSAEKQQSGATDDGNASDGDDDSKPLDGLLGDVKERIDDDRQSRDGGQSADSATDGSSLDLETEADDDSNEDDAELSDEEIEAVFKETMSRVQERREREDGD